MSKGIVVKTTGRWHTVKTGKEIFLCTLRGSFRIQGKRNTNPVAVGDLVQFESSGNGTGVITGITERKNYIIRRATNLSKENQILAANIDQAILMFTLDMPATPLEFVDRFLLTAEAYHIPCTLLINKIDLYGKEKTTMLEEIERIYTYAGYAVVPISVKQKMNLERVQKILKDKLTLISGNSGVGKSTLINQLNPSLHLKTGDISTYHLSGKHTTTYAEMVEVADNSYIIDSPGIRGFGLIDIDKNEIGLYFTDIFKLSKNCQFTNCTHTHEPNCAVVEAVIKGVLHESRYRSYFNIYNDKAQKYRID